MTTTATTTISTSIPRRAAVVCVVLGLMWALSGCAGLLDSPPPPGPVPFPEISSLLGSDGIDVSSWTAGDDGCDDPTLSATAIRFDAAGLDATTAQHLRIYIFRNRDAWERRLADVDSCAAAWAEDPATFQIVQISPYVVAGQGPWPPEFSAALRKGLTEAAGTGD